MKHLVSLNGDKNQVTFIRGNDGDICISFDIPSKGVIWESVRVGVGNSGGQKVPGYVKDALIKVCEAIEEWEREEEEANNEVDDTKDFCDGYENKICEGCDLSLLWCQEQRMKN